MAALARLIERMLPALLMASSVTLLSAGIFAYAPPGTLSERVASPSPSPPSRSPSPAATAASSPSGLSGTAQPTLPAGATLAPSSAGASPTRVVIPSLDIDLPVVRGDLELPGNGSQFPLCDVAQFLVEYPTPGVPGSTYIYAHARAGMFLPLLEASHADDGAELLGALVEVYSADLTRHLYEIFVVKRHATDLSLASDVPRGEYRLVLQTSEGPRGTIPKLQVAARRISVAPATAREALPEARPRVCR
ncbi:MAG: hypothetical protein M3N29_05605 [Chloroflexota bacterium]|nr:hypothetical protein [Chloroflexota bacterium]